MFEKIGEQKPTSIEDKSNKNKINKFKDYINSHSGESDYLDLKTQFQNLLKFENSELLKGLRISTDTMKKTYKKFTNLFDIASNTETDISPEDMKYYGYSNDVVTVAKKYNTFGVTESFKSYGDAKMEVQEQLTALINEQIEITPSDINKLSDTYGELLHSSPEKALEYIAQVATNLNTNKEKIASAKQKGELAFMQHICPYADIQEEDINKCTVDFSSPLGIYITTKDIYTMNKITMGEYENPTLSSESLVAEGFTEFRKDIPIIFEFKGPGSLETTRSHEEFHQLVRLGDRQEKYSDREKFVALTNDIKNSENLSDEELRGKFEEILKTFCFRLEEELLAFNIEGDHEFYDTYFNSYFTHYTNADEIFTATSQLPPARNSMWVETYTKYQQKIKQAQEALKILRAKGYSNEWISTSLSTNFDQKRRLTYSQWLPLAIDMPYNK